MLNDINSSSVLEEAAAFSCLLRNGKEWNFAVYDLVPELITQLSSFPNIFFRIFSKSTETLQWTMLWSHGLQTNREVNIGVTSAHYFCLSWQRDGTVIEESMPGDGDCFFHALYQQLTEGERYQWTGANISAAYFIRTVRELLSRCVLTNWEAINSQLSSENINEMSKLHLSTCTEGQFECPVAALFGLASKKLGNYRKRLTEIETIETEVTREGNFSIISNGHCSKKRKLSDSKLNFENYVSGNVILFVFFVYSIYLIVVIFYIITLLIIFLIYFHFCVLFYRDI